MDDLNLLGGSGVLFVAFFSDIPSGLLSGCTGLLAIFCSYFLPVRAQPQPRFLTIPPLLKAEAVVS
jgi:hypothetical protein